MQLFIHMRFQKASLLLATASLLVIFASPSSLAAIKAELLYKKESIYNSIFVLQEGQYRTLRFGYKDQHFRESTYNPDDPTELPSIYTRYATIGVAYPGNLNKAAIIGMGGGRTTWYLSHHIPDLEITAVELDPEIVKIADKYFDVRAGDNLNVVTSDGRIFIRRTKETFDYILVDAYRGHFVPFHMITKEFYELAESRLTPGGVVVQNIAPSTMLYDRALATIGAVFDNIDLYQAGTNVVAIAYNGPQKSEEDLLATAAQLQAEYGFRYDLDTMIRTRMQTPDWEQEKVLTDDFAPANYLKSIERHNRDPEAD